ncbi:MAG: helix-hairpin-helix domain-containing protein [Bacteroidota bacterium]
MSLSLHLRPRPLLLLYLLAMAVALSAQTDTTFLEDATDLQEQIIEDEAANTSPDGDEFAFNAAFELLSAYRKRPLDLNKATYDELAEMILLNPIQIAQLLDYRERMNGLVSIYELQVIPSLDLETIRRLQPFVRVGGGDLDDFKISVGRMLAEGDRELYVRWQRRLETARGYELGPEDATNYYLGSPDRLYVRFRQKYSNNLSFGMTAEKDPGEAFFAENNAKRGFDYYSAHFFLKDLNRTVKALAIGDFNVSFGQGLILYTGFGFGKSSQTTNIGRSNTVIRPYTSVSEFNFMRGVGTTLAFGEKLELSVFGSRRGRTANLISPLDTTDLEGEQLGISSLGLTGFARTPSEVEDRNAITQVSYGGSFRYRASQRLQLGLNFLGENLSQPLDLRDRAYNRFFFQGTDLQNVSIDYRYRLRNFTFFGEVAASNNATLGSTDGTGIAQLHGLMLGLDRYIDVSLLYRKYDVDYQALNARPFGETTGGRNEEGLYFGMELRPGAHWRINAYYDIFRFPYLRFNIDAPDQGREWRFRITYWQKRKLETYLEFRSETKGIGADAELFPQLETVIPRTRFQGRLHFAYKITPFLEWRSRFDAGFTEDAEEGRQKGFTIFQDIHYRPRGPFSFSARYAVLNTDDFDVRFYHYENGLLYNARVVPYYGRGTRAFFLMRYKGIRNLTIEARIAQTFFTDGRTIGSGLEATDGPRATNVGVQLIWRF